MTGATPVIIFDLLMAPTPVFHAFEEWGARPHPAPLEDGWRRNEHRTRCGLVTWRVEWRDRPGTFSETRNEIRAGHAIRLDNAWKFARPCSRCFR